MVCTALCGSRRLEPGPRRPGVWGPRRVGWARQVSGLEKVVQMEKRSSFILLPPPANTYSLETMRGSQYVSLTPAALLLQTNGGASALGPLK